MQSTDGELPRAPIPLNYANPAKQSEPPKPAIPVRQSPFGGTLSRADAAALVLQTTDRTDLAFVARSLEQQRIAYFVMEAPASYGVHKLPLKILVRAEDEPPAVELVRKIMARRQRSKDLNQQNPGGLRTRGEGGSWPDPYRSGDVW